MCGSLCLQHPGSSTISLLIMQWLTSLFQMILTVYTETNMLHCIAERIPEIYKFGYSSYKVDSKLQLGEFMILFLVGPQQDDPLSGLLFCLGIHPILQSTSAPFTTGLFDTSLLVALERQ